MKKIILFLAVVFAACNSHDDARVERKLASPPPTPETTVVAQPNDGVLRVTTTELDALMKADKVVVVDVRTQDAYDRAHITGAKFIPFTVIGQRTGELPRDKMIVTYCS